MPEHVFEHGRVDDDRHLVLLGKHSTHCFKTCFQCRCVQSRFQYYENFIERIDDDALYGSVQAGESAEVNVFVILQERIATIKDNGPLSIGHWNTIGIETADLLVERVQHLTEHFYIAYIEGKRVACAVTSHGTVTRV